MYQQITVFYEYPGQLAEHLRPLFLDLPIDTPIVATHCIVGMAAVACGFKRVYNLVIDNHAQWFVIVPGALNLVQGPKNYAALLKMGVPQNELLLAGHWAPKELVVNVPADCQARIDRAISGKPIRILLTVGGAGAQMGYIQSLVSLLGPDVEAGKVVLIINAGDHVHIKAAIEETLSGMGLHKGTYDMIDTLSGVEQLAKNLAAGQEPKKNVALLSFGLSQQVVYATDHLSRFIDLLAAKPSELAFFPVPKLLLRRVGDHERFSAIRSAEVGDGTPECRTPEDAAAWVKLLLTCPELRKSLNLRILKNAEIGIYDGCKKAAELALTKQQEAA